MRERGNGPVFKRGSALWSVILFIIMGIVFTGYANEDISTQSLAGILIVLLIVWPLIVLGMILSIRLYRRYHIATTDLTVDRTCEVAEAYFSTMDHRVEKEVHRNDVLFYIYHPHELVHMWITSPLHRTKLSVNVSREGQTDEYFEWLYGLGEAIREAERNSL